MYGVNLHHKNKSPIITTTIEEELICGRTFLANLRKRFPKKEIVFLLGNHEVRLNRYITENCKSFSNLLRIEKFLELDRQKIEWHPYQFPYQIDRTNCWAMHSPPSYGVNGARTSLLKAMDVTMIYGCTHRIQSAHLTGRSGTIHSAYFNGWLGSTNLTEEHVEVFSYTKNHHDWQHGFSIVNVKDDSFHVNPYIIREYSCVVDGYFYHEGRKL